MGILSKKSVAAATVKPSYSNKLDEVKSMFKTAYDKAVMLNAEMETDIQIREERIKNLNVEIGNIQSIQKDTQEFMSNLEKFI